MDLWSFPGRCLFYGPRPLNLISNVHKFLLTFIRLGRTGQSSVNRNRLRVFRLHKAALKTLGRTPGVDA